MKFKKGVSADKMDKAEKIELEYYELCPECGKEAYGFCDENLTGICNHCGAEIKICSHCPSSCVLPTPK